MIFPNESQEYRDARDALLRQEVELMRQLEAVTAQRQSLPPGGEIPEDYVFDRIGDDGAPTGVRMSELFGDSDTLMLYSPMFPRLCGDDRPIPTHGIFAELPVDQTPCPHAPRWWTCGTACTHNSTVWGASWPSSRGGRCRYFTMLSLEC
jgi:predicted dithiol-disulfide oxidoreductase (DUF899 family)